MSKVKKILDTTNNRKRLDCLEIATKRRISFDNEVARTLGFNGAAVAYKALGKAFLQECKKCGRPSINEAMKRDDPGRD